jgi:hypothetical protein
MNSVRETYNILLGTHWTTTAADSEVCLDYYFVSPGKREMSASLVAQTSAATDTGILTLKIQESPTTVSSDWTDVTDGGFTAFADTDTAGLETIYFSTIAGTRYLRSYATVSGTPTFFGAAILSVIKRQA